MYNILIIMVNYQDYLLVLSQLSRHAIARLKIGPREIVIEKSGMKWKLSTQIFDGEGALPSHVEECVSGASFLKWKEKIFLVSDPLTATVHLIQEVDPLRDFQLNMAQFLSLADEWQEIVAGFAVH